MTSKDKIILPEKYYLDYFNYLLAFVEKHYEHILDEPEYLFYQEFRNLSEDAKCLYLRFSNRRGDYFRLSKINYPEINNRESAKEELLIHDFIRVNESVDPVQFKLFTKAELASYFDFIEPKFRKEEILLELTETDLSTIHELEEIAEVKKNEEVEFLKMLFFGNRYGQMTEFVIRDVGNIKLEQLNESKFKPWFKTREEALGVMHISQLRRMVREIIEAELPLEEYLEDLPWAEWLKHDRSRKSAEKLLLNIGAHFERLNQYDHALTYYQFTPRHPSRERQIRIFEKTDKSEEALILAQDIVKDPSNASELTFANDYLNRSGIRINRSMTERLKDATSITIEKDHRTVEQCSLEYFENEGLQGVHAENFIWRGLFGLVFWHELFDEDFGSFHHPLQRQPSDLNDAIFFESRAPLLSERLKKFKNRKALTKHVQDIYSQKDGMANRFVTWHESLLPAVEIMIQKLPLKGLKNVLLEMAKNMKENSTGFPDLFLWNDQGYIFYEIKSQNDHLSAQQLFWLNFLSSQKIEADVLRVYYSNN
ncbi:MAG: VRR-NUC domain-containing protein [Bacteroidota bacterium]